MKAWADEVREVADHGAERTKENWVGCHTLIGDKRDVDHEGKMKRIRALDRLYRLRLTYIYGSLVPRTIDESVEVTGKGGRDLVHDWKIAISQDEFAELPEQYAGETSLTSEELDMGSWPGREK